jgi:nucleotide-binding universal stress UspA family protein
MQATKNILVAVEDSEASDRAVSYVAQILDGRREFEVVLFHMPASIPPQLLEFGGAEDPAQEQRAQAKLGTARATWMREVASAAQPIFARAKTRLHQAHIAAEAVKTELFIPPAEQSLEAGILETARTHECGTVVVGREEFSRFQDLFRSHVADKLIQEADHLTLWIVQ